MKKHPIGKEEKFWIALIILIYVGIEVAAYIATGHLIFPFCRYSCGNIDWLNS